MVQQIGKEMAGISAGETSVNFKALDQPIVVSLDNSDITEVYEEYSKTLQILSRMNATPWCRLPT
ncbi:hypothetical protein OROMI_020047 [Orobanche minor]